MASFLVERQAVALLVQHGDAVQVVVHMFMEGAGVQVDAPGVGNMGWLASTREPAAMRRFGTVGAAVRYAAGLWLAAFPERPGVRVPVYVDRLDFIVPRYVPAR